jgi:protein-tyrosine-phosphatase
VLLEVNPRFWGSLPLAVAAGADFPALWWDLAVHSRESEAAYAAGIVKADLTGEFDLAVDRFEEARGLERLSTAAAGLATAIGLLASCQAADSWAADDPEPWREERLELMTRIRQSLRKRLPGRSRRRRARFEDIVRRISEQARGRPLRLTVVGRDNVCRSAFADRLLKLRLAGLPVEIASAGFVPRRGAFPDAATLGAATAFGVDLSGHSSNALSVRDLERADVLILFDEDTQWRLRQMSPDFAAEVVTLPGLTDGGPKDFESIAAALGRLAAVVERSFRPAPRPIEASEAPPAARPQAA